MSITYPAPGKQNTLYVGGFGPSMNEEKLYNTFIIFGDIKEVFIPKDRTIEGGHRGFGFIEFESKEDARAAIDNMHMNEIFGDIIRCNLARPTRITTAGVHTAPIWELEAAAGGIEEPTFDAQSSELGTGDNISLPS